MGGKFRHEFKYVVSAREIEMLKNRVNHLLLPDRHAGERGLYSVRSLYFDDYGDCCFHDNEFGPGPREKFRIRIYNHSDARIMLECKRKDHGMTLKTSCPLTRAQAELLMAGETPGAIEHQDQPLRKLMLLMLTRRMRPKIIVEYDRIPYVYPDGNVRVTLDTNIASSKAVERFFDDRIPSRPVMPVGRQLLEVKYDEFLPDFVYRNLQLENLTQTAFSKYYIARKYTL